MDENNLQAERSVQQNDDGVVMDQELPTTGPEIMPAHRLGDAGVARPTAAVTPVIVQRRPTRQQRMEGQAAPFNVSDYGYRYCSIGTLRLPRTCIIMVDNGIEIDVPESVIPRGAVFTIRIEPDKIYHMFAAVNSAFSPIFIAVIKDCEDDIKEYLDFDSTGHKLDHNSKNVLEKYIVLVPAASSGPSSHYLTDLEVASLKSVFNKILHNPQQNAVPSTSDGGSASGSPTKPKPVATVNPIFWSAQGGVAPTAPPPVIIGEAPEDCTELLPLPCEVCTVGTLFCRPMGRVAITDRGLELDVPGASRANADDARVIIQREEIVAIQARPPLPGVRIWVTGACATRVSEQLHIQPPPPPLEKARHIILYPSSDRLTEEQVMLCLEVMSLLAGPYEPPAGPYEPPAGPYQPPAAPYEPPAGPYEPSAAPYEPPAAPYEPPAGPYEPPAAPYEPPAGPYEPPPAAPTLAAAEQAPNTQPTQ